MRVRVLGGAQLAIVDVDREQVEVVLARALVRLKRDEPVLGGTLHLAGEGYGSGSGSGSG